MTIMDLNPFPLSLLNNLPLPRCAYCQQAVVDLELVVDILQVEADRVFRDADVPGNQLVGQAPGKVFQHFALSPAQQFHRIGSDQSNSA